jgi:trigger factor
MPDETRTPDKTDKYYIGVVIDAAADKSAADSSREALEEAAVTKAVQSSSLDVPDDELEETTAYLASGYYQRMKYDSMFAGKAYMPLPEELEEQRRLIREQAYLSIKTELVLKQVAEAEGLEVTDEELEGEASRMADRQGLPLDAVKAFLGDDLGSLRQDLLMRKAADFIYQHAVFV